MTKKILFTGYETLHSRDNIAGYLKAYIDEGFLKGPIDVGPVQTVLSSRSGDKTIDSMKGVLLSMEFNHKRASLEELSVFSSPGVISEEKAKRIREIYGEDPFSFVLSVGIIDERKAEFIAKRVNEI